MTFPAERPSRHFRRGAPELRPRSHPGGLSVPFDVLVEPPLRRIIGGPGHAQSLRRPGMVQICTHQSVIPIHGRKAVEPGFLQQSFQPEAFITLLHFAPSHSR